MPDLTTLPNTSRHMPQPHMAKHKGKAVSRACFCNASKNKTNSGQGTALKGRAADNRVASPATCK